MRAELFSRWRNHSIKISHVAQGQWAGGQWVTILDTAPRGWAIWTLGRTEHESWTHCAFDFQDALSKILTLQKQCSFMLFGSGIYIIHCRNSGVPFRQHPRLRNTLKCTGNTEDLHLVKGWGRERVFAFFAGFLIFILAMSSVSLLFPSKPVMNDDLREVWWTQGSLLFNLQLWFYFEKCRGNFSLEWSKPSLNPFALPSHDYSFGIWGFFVRILHFIMP